MSNRKIWLQAIGVVGVVSLALGLRFSAGNEPTQQHTVGAPETLPAGFEVTQNDALRQLHKRFDQESSRELAYFVDVSVDKSIWAQLLSKPPKLVLRDRDGCVTIQEANPAVAGGLQQAYDGSEALYLPEVGSAFAHRDGIVRISHHDNKGVGSDLQGTVLEFGEVAILGTFVDKNKLQGVTNVVIPKHCQHYEFFFTDMRGTAKQALHRWDKYSGES